MMGRTTAGRGRATGTASKTGGFPDTGIGPPRTSCSKLQQQNNDIFQRVTQNKHNSKQNTNSRQQNGEAVALSTQSNLRNLNRK